MSRMIADKRISLLKLLHFSLSSVFFYVSWSFFRYQELLFWIEKDFRYNYYILLLFMGILFFLEKTYNAYLLGYSPIKSLAIVQFLSQFLSITVIYCFTAVAWYKIYSPFYLLLSLPFFALLDALWSTRANTVFYECNPSKESLFLYGKEKDLSVISSLRGKPVEKLYVIKDRLLVKEESFSVEETLKDYDAVFYADIDLKTKEKILTYCAIHQKPCFFVPNIAEAIMMGSHHIAALSSPIMELEHKNNDIFYLFIKRFTDIVVSLIGIVVLSPLMIVVALLIKIQDKGPAFYKQVRLTKDNKTFKILKFRSMKVDAEKDGIARLSTGENDERITPIGRFIRSCRMDELPQLFNILKGEMTLVGPRPERPEIAEQYKKTIPEFDLRLQVKAGLTGYAQVYGKYNTDPNEKLKFDLLYINNMNILTDLELILATIVVLFSKESTEGFDEK